MTSCYKIFEYWRDKYIMPNGEVCGRGEGFPIAVVRDEYVPECWACGRPAKNRDVLTDETYDMKLSDIWADSRINSRLQKCHIVARQFGGPDTPDNLFLLCENCHEASPDTRNERAFFRWVYRRRSECYMGINTRRFADEFLKEIEMRGYVTNEFVKKCVLRGVDLSEVVQDSLKNAGYHSTRIAESSIVCSIVDELEQRII